MTSQRMAMATSDGARRVGGVVARDEATKADGEHGSKRRLNKNRPVEMSSKRPVAEPWPAVDVPRKVRRDPRFEALSGTLDEAKFRKSYGFVFDQVIPAEKEELQERMKKEKNAHKKKGMQAKLTRLEQTLKKEAQQRKVDRREKERNDAEKEAVRQGKRPYYLKKSDVKKQEWAEKYQELKRAGKVQDYLAKKRKRRAAKDHKLIPDARRTTAADKPS